jgi:hypothetical protein
LIKYEPHRKRENYGESTITQTTTVWTTQTIRPFNNMHKNIWENLNAYFHLIGQRPDKKTKEKGRRDTDKQTAR